MVSRQFQKTLEHTCASTWSVSINYILHTTTNHTFITMSQSNSLFQHCFQTLSSVNTCRLLYMPEKHCIHNTHWSLHTIIELTYQATRIFNFSNKLKTYTQTHSLTNRHINSFILSSLPYNGSHAWPSF